MELHIQVKQSGLTASELIAEHSDLSRSLAKQLMQHGAVWISAQGKPRRIRRASQILSTGSELHLYYRKELLQVSAPQPTLHTDEGDYSIWFKPAGLMSQGSKYGDFHTTPRQVELLEKHKRPVLLVHRLDRYTHGLTVLAHTRTAQRQLAQLFASQGVEKHYRALVCGVVPTDDSPLEIDTPVDAKPARSRVRVLESSATLSLVDVQILTGRKHQVRKHLAGLGFPVLGDRQNGGMPDSSQVQPDLQLCAHSLAFNCPINGAARYYQVAPEISDTMQAVLEKSSQ